MARVLSPPSPAVLAPRPVWGPRCGRPGSQVGATRSRWDEVKGKGGMKGNWITVPSFAGERDGVQHFFGTRMDPVALDSSTGRTVVSVKQVHRTDALVLDRPLHAGETFSGEWDALVTNQDHVLLTIRTADCVPVLLHDPGRRIVAALHAGWRGAVAGLVPKVLDLMRQRFSCKPASIRMGIGPSIGTCCYEVDEAVLAPLRKGFSDWRSVVQDLGRGKAILDLQGLVRGQAQAAGVQEDGIHRVRVCTACHPRLFHSYRRDGEVKSTMVSGIMLTGGGSRPRH